MIDIYCGGTVRQLAKLLLSQIALFNFKALFKILKEHTTTRSLATSIGRTASLMATTFLYRFRSCLSGFLLFEVISAKAKGLSHGVKDAFQNLQFILVLFILLTVYIHTVLNASTPFRRRTK